MKHLGDITLIKCNEVEPVHIICGGSPCQDLSVAGLRKGLSGERSGLYMEQIRLMKEHRELAKENIGRFLLWENVVGAFSSNKGKDFCAVLTEAVRVLGPDAPEVPIPKGGWPKAGVLFFGKGSLAYRVHDAQYWGAPQRRCRISMLVDYESDSAPRCVFGEPLSVPHDYKKKGNRPVFMSLELKPDVLGETEWVDAGYPYQNYNITEYPTVDGDRAMLWDTETGDYTELESKLSNIVDLGADIKYLLSGKACRGILERAKRRGKELPEELRLALENQAREDFDPYEYFGQG